MRSYKILRYNENEEPDRTETKLSISCSWKTEIQWGYATTNDATTNDATTNDATTNDATTNDATTNEYYNEQFLSIKSGCYNERGLLSADVARACA
jgi:hypothetical protein